jgi:NACHT domain
MIAYSPGGDPLANQPFLSSSISRAEVRFMSNGPLNTEAIISSVLTDLVKDAAKNTSKALLASFQKLADAYRKDLSAYLDGTLAKCLTVKTFLNWDTPVHLDQIYVNTVLTHRSRIHDDESFIRQLLHLKYVLVIGTAGSGKSMFMKHLFVRLCRRTEGRVPLFVEMRYVNERGPKTFTEFLHETITAPGAKLTPAQFEAGLSKGHFLLILDGFDEINLEHRKTIEQELQRFSHRYPAAEIVISSRPDDVIERWLTFYTFRIEPMDEPQIASFLEKIEYDHDTKKRFTVAIRSGKFHSTFISNPLLITMMLITFRQVGDIPAKLHIFFENAFLALYSRHDASKQYLRKLHSGLNSHDFKNFLSSFCAETYAREKFFLTEQEAHHFLAIAGEYENLAIRTEGMLHDLLQAVCILQRDGIYVTFSHRSFQEYFTAVSLLRGPMGTMRDLLDYLARRSTDVVVKMAFDMNQRLIEREWILPHLRHVVSRIKRINPATHPIKYVSVFYNEVGFSCTNANYSFKFIDPNGLGYFKIALGQLYPDLYLMKGTTSVSKRESADLVNSIMVRFGQKGDARLRSGAKLWEFALKSPDGEWVRRTWLPAAATEEREALLRLHARLAKSAATLDRLEGKLFNA